MARDAEQRRGNLRGQQQGKLRRRHGGKHSLSQSATLGAIHFGTDERDRVPAGIKRINSDVTDKCECLTQEECMKFFRTTVLGILILYFTAGCGKQPDPARFENPLVTYSFSKFTNFESFRGELVFRHTGAYATKSSAETNYFITIVLVNNWQTTASKK